MKRFLAGSATDVQKHYRELSVSRYPFGQLNARIMKEMADKGRELEEEEIEE